jgi:hypothetical protein
LEARRGRNLAPNVGFENELLTCLGRSLVGLGCCFFNHAAPVNRLAISYFSAVLISSFRTGNTDLGQIRPPVKKALSYEAAGNCNRVKPITRNARNRETEGCAEVHPRSQIAISS